MTKHFFFTDTLGAGGISTNVVALSSYVATQGERPVIVPVSTRESSACDYCATFADLKRPVDLISIVLRRNKENYVFFTNSVRTLLIAYLLLLFSKLGDNQIKLIFCVYNPWEFVRKDVWCSIYRRLIVNIGTRSIFFMNRACYEAHKVVCPPDSIAAIFLPLAIPAAAVSVSKVLDLPPRAVLTVGRFVGFKLHYMRALLAYAQVRKSVNFCFIGYGEGETELKLFVERNKLKNVHFIERVRYEQLQAFYKSAFCYVGMGTTLVEASSVGTPSVVAVAGVPGDNCYGLFIEQTEYDMGEYRFDKCLVSLSSCLDKMLSLSEEDEILLRSQHVTFAKQFSRDSVGAMYMGLCETVPHARVDRTAIFYWVQLCVMSLLCFSEMLFLRRKSRYDAPY